MQILKQNSIATDLCRWPEYCNDFSSYDLKTVTYPLIIQEWLGVRFSAKRVLCREKKFNMPYPIDSSTKTTPLFVTCIWFLILMNTITCKAAIKIYVSAKPYNTYNNQTDN